MDVSVAERAVPQPAEPMTMDLPLSSDGDAAIVYRVLDRSSGDVVTVGSTFNSAV